MNNLLTRTLFILLLLSTAVLPAVQDKKIKNNRWREIGDEIIIAGAIVGIGTLVGYTMGRQIGGDAGAFAGAKAAMHAGIATGAQVGAAAGSKIVELGLSTREDACAMGKIAGAILAGKIVVNEQIKVGAILGHKEGLERGGPIGALAGAKAGGLVVLIRILMNSPAVS